jgi:hypothetical protein
MPPVALGGRVTRAGALGSLPGDGGPGTGCRTSLAWPLPVP